MPDEKNPVFELLRVLTEHAVDFVVVGGVAGVLQGAPIFTADVDILHSRSAENVKRLLAALSNLRAEARGDPRRLVPDASHLAGPGHVLLSTRLGPLDVLGTIERDTRYEDLLDETDVLEVGGLTVRVLSLPRLIAVKEATGRDKDKAVLPLLRATLSERSAR